MRLKKEIWHTIVQDTLGSKVGCDDAIGISV
jgi:hypothetical protein